MAVYILSILFIDELLKEATTVREERNRLDEELLGLKAAAAVIESTKQEEIEDMKRKCDEEVASLQKVMDGRWIISVNVVF